MKKALSDLSTAELWQLFPIVLTKYDPRWPQWFAEEKLCLEKLLGSDQCQAIHHIGSTAIPGMPLAKPTIDLLVELATAAPIESLLEQMLAQGYELNEVPQKPAPHLLLLKGYTPAGFADKVFHIHLRYPGKHKELIFRDYLCAHPEAAAAYAKLKARLAKTYEHDRDAYTGAKTAFINRIISLEQK